MRKAILSGVALAAFTIVGAAIDMANAENLRRNDNWFWNFRDERWCLNNQSITGLDCSYRTIQECNFSRSGMGGFCVENLRHFVQPDPRPRKRAKRVQR